MRKKILLGKPIRSHTPESLLDFVKSMYLRKKTSKESVSVPGITCYFGKKIMVRLKDKNRIFTDEEIKLLSLEYNKELPELMEILLSRKIKIINSQGELYAKPKRVSKGNVKSGRKTRKKTSENKLQLTGSSEHLLPKEPLPVEHES